MANSSVWEEFKHIFRPEAETTTGGPEDPATVADAEFRKARRADADSAEATKYIQEYRAWWSLQIDNSDPDPDKGVESAAMRGFVQATYRKCLRRLDDQLRIARE